MRVLSLEAEHFKRLRAVAITPSGNIVEVTGDNASGKTSTLDAIWAALGGKDAVPDKPVHSGEEKASIVLTLGDGDEVKLKVTRKFRVVEGISKTDLIVESAEGARFSSPQSMLDALVGEMCFDPLAFTRCKAEEQIEALRKFVPDVDFANIEGLNKRDYDERTEVNRTAKQLRAQIAALPVGPEAAPERVDVAALEAELGRAATHNTDVERRRGAREAAEAKITALGDQIDELLKRADDLRAERAELRTRLDAAEALPQPIDVADLQQQLSFGRMANAAADVADKRFALERDAAEAEAKSTALTAAIQGRTDAAAAAVQKAKMPIEGLGFGDGFVTLNGEPFSQASKAQQIRASVAIAAAMNPKLRVAFIADGSLLDRKSWAALEEYAAAHDMQIWCETVTPHSATAIHIEDGGVRGAEGVGDVI